MSESNRDKRLSFRVSESELKKIDADIKKSGATRSDFFRQQILGKGVTVITGIDEFQKEHMKIGNNINQLVRLAHQGKIPSTDELEEIRKEFNNIWLSLNQLIQNHQ